ncbi:MAG: hypothetical protein Q9222_003030 [Ikaeria aurantiellina]
MSMSIASLFLHCLYVDVHSPSHLSIFKTGSKFDKDSHFYNHPALRGSFFGDSRRKTVIPRRRMLAPGFSPEAIRRGESRVVECIEKFMHMLGAHAKSGRPVDLTRGFMCSAADVVMNFAFHKPYNALDAKDFQSELLVPVVDFMGMQQWAFYFPKLFGAFFTTMSILPTWIVEAPSKAIRTQQNCFQMCYNQVKDLQSQSTKSEKEYTASVFDNTFNPNIEKGQVTPCLDNLAADAYVFVLAGTSTASLTLITGVFELLDHPDMMKRVKEELWRAIPDAQTMPNWTSLETLPYLV